MYKRAFIALSGALLLACEPAEIPTLLADNLSVVEGNANSTLVYSINLSAPAPKEVTLDYKTSDQSAEAGTDYTATSGSIVIAKGESSAQVEIEILGDTETEFDEVFWISYSNAQNVNVPNPFNTITLMNDDTGIDTSDAGYTTPTSYPGMTLVWSDEFNSTSLDLNSWNYESGAGGWGNQELQYYREGTSNTSFQNGKLVITAKEESFGGAPYTSARITTKDKQEFQFGRIDIRARLPFGQGIWPALWMLGANFPDVVWPGCGEIDIMELIGHEPNKVHGTAHWGEEGQYPSTYYTGTYTLPSADFSDEYHVFSLVWQQNSLQYYVDDNLFHTITTSNVGTATYRFNAPFFLIFNVAVGGQWPGSPDASTQFPQHMAVDYIRVFQ
jgi:beta-glucanase (GH16 family)